MAINLVLSNLGENKNLVTAYRLIFLSLRIVQLLIQNIEMSGPAGSAGQRFGRYKNMSVYIDTHIHVVE